MNKKTKKGFTLVELLVVIAILAILATVSVVGYTSFINKANMSVDQQAVEQINNYLQAYELSDGKPANVNEVINALAEGNLNIKDYVPLAKGMFFYWVKGENRVIYVDADDKIVFPEDYAGKTLSTADWYTLSGTIERSTAWEEKVTGTTAAVSSGEELYDFLDRLGKGDTTAAGVNTVELSGTVDMKGAITVIPTVAENLTIKSADAANPATLTGLRSDSEAMISEYQGTPRDYRHGMVGTVKAGTTVVIENVIIDGANVYNESSKDGASQFGLIAGVVEAGATLKLNNVTIVNSSLTGGQKVGALVGDLHGTLECTNVTVKDTTIIGACQTAVLVGQLRSTATFKYDSSLKVENVKVEQLFEGSDDVIVGANDTYYYHLKSATADAYYMYVGGTTSEYYWATQSVSAVDGYYKIEGEVVDGKQVWVYDSCSVSGSAVVE